MSCALKTTEKAERVEISLKNFATPFDERFKSFGVFYNGKSLQNVDGLFQFPLQGFEQLSGKIRQIFWQNNHLLLILQDNTVYRYSVDSGCKKLSIELGKLYAITLPQYFQGSLLSDGQNSYFFSDLGELQPVDIPAFYGGCYHYDRLILCNNTQILFSHIGDSMDFKKNGGKIDLVDTRGKILSAIAQGELIYLFRERGIDKLVLSGAEERFSIHALFDTAKIAAGSVCVANDGKIYFYTQAGLFTLQNKKLQKVNVGLELNCKFFDEMPAIFYKNCYYLLVHRQNNLQSTLFAIYPKSESLAEIAKNVNGVFGYFEHFFVLIDGKLYCNFKTANTTANTIRGKILLQVINPFANEGLFKGLKVQSPHLKQITVQSKFGVNKKFVTKDRQYIPINLRGREFTIAIESVEDAFCLEQLQLHFTALNGVTYGK